VRFFVVLHFGFTHLALQASKIALKEGLPLPIY